MASNTISIAGVKKPVIQGAAAFSKGIAVLQMIFEAKAPPTLNELVKQSGMTRPTMHRILKALAAENLVVCGAGKTYKLGSRLIQFSAKALEHNEIAQIGAPILDWLCQQTQEAVHLATVSGRDMVYLAKRDSPQVVRIATSVGGRVIVHGSAIGKSILAFLPEAERQEILENMEYTQFTKNTARNETQLRQQLSEIRELGYAVSDEESHSDIFCFAAPIFDHNQRVAGAVSVSVPKFRLKANRRVYLSPLIKSCTEISRKIGAV